MTTKIIKQLQRENVIYHHCYQQRINHCFESSDVASESEMDDLSNYQDSIEVDYSKTNHN